MPSLSEVSTFQVSWTEVNSQFVASRSSPTEIPWSIQRTIKGQDQFVFTKSSSRGAKSSYITDRNSTESQSSHQNYSVKEEIP